MTPANETTILEKALEVCESDHASGDTLVWSASLLSEAIQAEQWVPFGQYPTANELGSLTRSINAAFAERHPKSKAKATKPIGPTGMGQNGLAAAIKPTLRPFDEFIVYSPAPVVAINRYGVVKWLADGRQHKAGEFLLPRNARGMQTVRFSYNGRQIERSTGWMLETAGWRKTRKKAKTS